MGRIFSNHSISVNNLQIIDYVILPSQVRYKGKGKVEYIIGYPNANLQDILDQVRQVGSLGYKKYVKQWKNQIKPISKTIARNELT